MAESGYNCVYANLNNYNVGVGGSNDMIKATSTVGVNIVPAWNHIPSYDTLVKGGNGCGCYPSIYSAYEDCCQKPEFMKYRVRNCPGNTPAHISDVRNRSMCGNGNGNVSGI